MIDLVVAARLSFAIALIMFALWRLVGWLTGRKV